MAGLAYFILPGISGWVMSRRAAMQSLPLRVLTAAVCWTVLQLVPVQVIASLQILGVIRRINITPLVWLQVLVLIAVVTWRMRQNRTGKVRFVTTGPGTGRELVPATLAAAAVFVAAMYASSAMELLLFYPSGSDALRYHFPLAVRWLQDGSLRLPDSGVWQFSLPSNAEIGMMALLATGWQSLATLSNWLAAVVLAVASYVIAGQLSGSRTAAIASTLIVLSLPPVLYQAFSGYVDLYATAYYVGAIALFLNRYQDVPGARTTTGTGLDSTILFLASLACGISVGTKPVYCFYAGLFLLFALLVLRKERSRRMRPMPVLVLLMAAGLMLPSAFWFARAAYRTGNPFYPLEVRIPGRVLLAGVSPGAVTSARYEDEFVQSRSGWLTYPWTEWKRTPGYLLIPYGTSMGAGALFATFVPIGLAFAVVRSFRQGKAGSLSLAVLLLAWLAGLAGWWLFLRRVLRFGMPLWVLVCCFSALMFGSVRGGRLRALHALLLCAALSTAVIASFPPLHSILGRMRAGELSRSDYYSYPEVIDELPPGSRVLSTTKRFNTFSLAGASLSNRVIPEFEAPKNVSRDYLQKEEVSFVIETPDTVTGDPGPPCEGLVLFRSGTLRESDSLRATAWRIWRVTEAAAPH